MTTLFVFAMPLVRSPVLFPEILASESAELNWATVNDPKVVALPEEVTCPVKVAFVVTVPALPVTLV